MLGALREFLGLGLLIGGCGLLMLFFQPPGTAQFVVSGLSALIGLLMVASVVFVQKRMNRLDPHDDD
ncbi:MAG: hypothetical protein MUF38_01050 [Anaerolineae bacterium]|nr:hypothetical protein [Anaerolineae bacterium]